MTYINLKHQGTLVYRMTQAKLRHLEEVLLNLLTLDVAPGVKLIRIINKIMKGLSCIFPATKV